MIYFVTEKWIKENTPITDNVDMTDVMPWIKTAAELWIQPILGMYFYNDLLTKYNAQTLSSDEVALVAMIKPAIAWRAASDAVYGLSRQLKNKGIQSQSGDFSASVELDEVQFAMAHYRQKGEFYETLIIKYLKENRALFANFTSDSNTDSIIKPQKGDNLGTSIILI